MGFFDANNNSDAPKSATIIAPGAKIEGTLHISNHLHIEGEIIGNIHSSESVTVGKNGRVNGDIFAKKTSIAGKFNGNISAQIVEILDKGELTGSVSCPEFVIERGGIFEGQSKKIEKNSTQKQKILS